MSQYRKRKIPKRYGEWETELSFGRREKKDWEVEDILQRRGEGDNEEVLVKWSNWNGPNTWVGLQCNPELWSYLNQNRANPDSCTLVKVALMTPSQTQSVNSDCMALRQAIFDSLSEVRYSPDGSIGRQTRVSVKVPFRKEEFDVKFQTLGLGKIPVGEKGNVDCYITGQDLTRVLGPGWDSRCYKTSTKSFVSFKELIHLSWGYKNRTDYSHVNCERCNHDGSGERPQLCTPEEVSVCGLPWLQLTYTTG